MAPCKAVDKDATLLFVIVSELTEDTAPVNVAFFCLAYPTTIASSSWIASVFIFTFSTEVFATSSSVR